MQRRAEELRRDVERLRVAQEALVRREAETELRRLAAEEIQRTDDELEAQAEASLATLERELAPARQHCQDVAERAQACGAALSSLKAEVLTWKESLEEAGAACEEALARAAEAALEEQRRRRKAKIGAEMRLLAEGLKPGSSSGGALAVPAEPVARQSRQELSAGPPRSPTLPEESKARSPRARRGTSKPGQQRRRSGQ